MSSRSSRARTICESCRSRKVKCDRARPRCDQCIRLSTPCIYDLRANNAQRSFRFVHQNVQREAGPPVIEDETADSAPRESGLIGVSEADFERLEARINAIQAAVNELKTTRQNPTALSPWDVTSINQGNDNVPMWQELDRAVEASESGPQGYLTTTDSGHTRYVDCLFWASICEKVTDLDQLLSQQAYMRASNPEIWRTGTRETSPESSDATAEEERGNGVLFSPDTHLSSARTGSSRYRLDDNPLDGFPERQQCEFLIQKYILGYHHIVPLIHPATFFNDFVQHWAASENPDALQSMSRPFKALALAVLFVASLVCPEDEWHSGFFDGSQSVVSTKLLHSARKALTLAQFPNSPCLESFIAYILLQATRMKDEEPLSCCAFVGIAYRTAQIIGLHRDPSIFFHLSSVEAEVRRRAWWHLVYIDVLVAMQAGLPPIIGQSTHDVKPVSELREDLVVNQTGPRYVADANTESEYSNQSFSALAVTAGGKMKATRVFRQIINRMYCSRKLTVADTQAVWQDLDSLETDFQARKHWICQQRMHLNIESNDQQRSIVETALQSTLIFCKWSCLLLSGLISFAWSWAYYPVLKKAGVDAHQWHNLRPQVIRHCHLFLKILLQLSCTTDFQAFQWSWPGQHQALHALTVLLTELERNPVEIENTIEIRKTIETVFALCDDECGFIGLYSKRSPLGPGGREAWALLRRLRRTAWLKADIDPGIVQSKSWALARVSKDAEQLLPDGTFEGFSVAQSALGISQNPELCTDASNWQTNPLNTMNMGESENLFENLAVGWDNFYSIEGRSQSHDNV